MSRYCECDKFTPSPNPRRVDCVRCGKLPEQPILNREVINEYFAGLREMLESAGRIRRPDPGEPGDPNFEWFAARCIARLQQGAMTYGANAFMHDGRRLPEEAIEEMLDVTNYALMELMKSSPDNIDAVHLGQANYHIFCAFQSILEYRAARLRP